MLYNKDDTMKPTCEFFVRASQLPVLQIFNELTRCQVENVKMILLPYWSIIKYLDVSFDDKLTFVPHIDVNTNKAFVCIDFILRSSKDSYVIDTFKTPNINLSEIFFNIISLWSPFHNINSHKTEIIQHTFWRLNEYNTTHHVPCSYFSHLVHE